MIFFIPLVLADCDESIFLTITWRFVPQLPGDMLLSLNFSFLYVFMFKFQFHLDNTVVMGLFGLGTIQLRIWKISCLDFIPVWLAHTQLEMSWGLLEITMFFCHTHGRRWPNFPSKWSLFSQHKHGWKLCQGALKTIHSHHTYKCWNADSNSVTGLVACLLLTPPPSPPPPKIKVKH